MGHRLIGSTPLIGKYNDNLRLVLKVSFNSVYIKTISTLWKTLGHRLIGSTLLIAKYNDNLHFM